MSDTRPGGSEDPLDFLSHQHRQVEQLWIQLEAAHGTDNEIQAGLAREIVAMLSQHDAVEVQLLYPTLRERGGERGEELANHSLAEHQKVREQLQEVDGKDPRDEQVWTTLSQCIADVQQHVEEEEGEIFPLLRQHWDADERVQLCQQMNEVLANAPTHP
jgi:hemerythrin superfamily protein